MTRRQSLEKRFAGALGLGQRDRVQVLLRADRDEVQGEIAGAKVIASARSKAHKRRVDAWCGDPLETGREEEGSIHRAIAI